MKIMNIIFLVALQWPVFLKLQKIYLLVIIFIGVNIIIFQAMLEEIEILFFFKFWTPPESEQGPPVYWGEIALTDTYHTYCARQVFSSYVEATDKDLNNPLP